MYSYHLPLLNKLCTIYVRMKHLHAGTIPGELCKHAKLTTRQLFLLEAAFSNSYYINKTTQIHLAQQTGLCERSIRSWFNRKRSKIKPVRMERTLYLCKYVHTCTCIRAKIFTCV